jgi:glycosyltransferase involved in cell wall biosynthesis
MALSDSQALPAQPHQPALRGGKRLKGIVAIGSSDQPLVTVVTAIFNGKQYVVECLESVLAQDYPNIEHVILDGGSTDGTLDVLRAYDDKIAFWKTEPDKGIYDAWNKAVDEARGEWICFLGVDDLFLPGAVSAYMELARNNPQAEYLSSQAKWIHSSGYERTIGKPWTWAGFRKWMCTAQVGSMHRRSLFDRLGRFDTSYRSAADYEFLLRSRQELKAAYMPVITVVMRAGGISDSYAALLEAKRARTIAGGRNNLLATIDFLIAILKFTFRSPRRRLESITARVKPG